MKIFVVVQLYLMNKNIVGKVYPEKYTQYNIDFTEDKLPQEALKNISRIFSDPELIVLKYLKGDSSKLENDLVDRLKVPKNKSKTISNKILNCLKN